MGLIAFDKLMRAASGYYNTQQRYDLPWVLNDSDELWCPPPRLRYMTDWLALLAVAIHNADGTTQDGLDAIANSLQWHTEHVILESKKQKESDVCEPSNMTVDELLFGGDSR